MNCVFPGRGERDVPRWPLWGSGPVVLKASLLVLETGRAPASHHCHEPHAPKHHHNHSHPHATHPPSGATQEEEQQFYIAQLFRRYGSSERLDFAGFQSLLHSLGLGSVKLVEKAGDSETHDHSEPGSARHSEAAEHEEEHHGHLHDGSTAPPSGVEEQLTSAVTDGRERKRKGKGLKGRGRGQTGEREGGGGRSRREAPGGLATPTAPALFAPCLNLTQLLTHFGLSPDSLISPDQFSYLCPALLYQIDRRLCLRHYHNLETGGAEEELLLVWVSGFVSITIISLLSLLGVVLVPILNQGCFKFMLTFLVALAVGTLSGDALLHLLPHVNGHRHGDGVRRRVEGLMALGGIYFLFIVEHCLGMYKHYRDHKKNGHKSYGHSHSHGHSHGGNCHSDQEMKDAGIASIAWMVIMGDGMHNFSDGLAIGAAFSANLTGGISTSVAVFCHELPHELGDFAVLLKAGMSVKQALVYNVLSALMAYIGMVIGTAVGQYTHNVTSWIFAVTAGMFLYVALVDMLPEMLHGDSEEHKRCQVGHFLLQNLGLLSGFSIMLLIAIFEDQIVLDFGF
uniref:Solute carrier family 39 member 10 n=2 Tax=Neogobius melanostomus TaxID=47308 RepID=A0A8C6WFW3_9GOBI